MPACFEEIDVVYATEKCWLFNALGGGGVKERLQRLLDPSQASDRFSTVLVYQRCRADRPGTIYMYPVHIMDMYMYVHQPNYECVWYGSAPRDPTL